MAHDEDDALRREFADRVREAALMVMDLLPAVIDSTGSLRMAALVGVMLTRAVCISCPQLPSFEWFCARVAELPDPRRPEGGQDN